MNISDIKGIIPPIVTPVDENEDVDEKGFRKLIDHCITKGLHGFFIAGTNGESLSLTQEQRDKAISIALSEAKGRVPILAGAMDTSTRRVIENIKKLEQMGGEFAVVSSVFYSNHSSPRETIRHFEEIAKNTSAKLIIYNIPPFTGQNITADMVIELSKIDKVVALKDSSGNFIQFLNTLNYFRGTSFRIMQGIPDLFAQSMLMGAHGGVLGPAPLFPEIYIDVYESSLKRDIDRIIQLTSFVQKISAINKFSAYGVSVTKYAMSTLGFFDGRVLKPSEPVKKEEEPKIREAIQRVNEEYKEFLGSAHSRA